MGRCNDIGGGSAGKKRRKGQPSWRHSTCKLDERLRRKGGGRKEEKKEKLRAAAED